MWDFSKEVGYEFTGFTGFEVGGCPLVQTLVKTVMD